MADSSTTRKREKKRLHSQAREMVVKLHQYFEKESQNDGPLLPVAQVQKRVADALGICARTVGVIIREKYGASGMEDNVLRSPKRSRKRSKPITGPGNYDADAIKSHVREYYARGERPTLKKLVASLNEIGLFRGTSHTSLQVILKNIGFEFKKMEKNQVMLVEKDKEDGPKNNFITVYIPENENYDSDSKTDSESDSESD